MNRYIFLFLIAAFSLLLHAKCVGQNNIVYGAGISYTNGVPTFVPPSKSARVAIDTVTSKWYEYATPGGWRWSGDRVQDISGCAAPAYTPGKAQSRLVLNSCTEAQNGHGPELYKYTGSAWLCLNCGGNYTAGDGIDITGTEITNTAPDQVVSITGAGINAVTGTYPNFTVIGTEVDGSTTNELQTLSVAGNNLTISDGNMVTIPTPSSALDALTDVTITSPANNQILQYNSAGSQWVNATLSAITGSGSNTRLAIWNGTGSITSSTYAGLATQTDNGITQQLGSYSFFGQIDQYVCPYFGQGAFAKDASGTVTPVSLGLGSGMITILEPVSQGFSFYAAPAGTTAATNIFTNNYLKFRVSKSGDVLIGAITATSGVKLEVTSTTGGVLFPRMTATQRDAISSPPDGLVVYNTTAAKLQVRAASAWVDLH